MPSIGSGVYAYTKKDKRMTSSWKYLPSSSKKYSKKDLMYITNSKDKVEDAQLRPKSRSDAGITNSMDKKLKFNLNMDVGVGGYGRNTALYFDRLYSIYPEHELSSLRQYVFIVRPNLNILDSSGNLVSSSEGVMGPNSSPSKDQFIRSIKKTYPHVLNNITGTEISDNDFMPILVGRTESLNLADYTLKSYKLTQPYSEYSLPYASNARSSETGGQFEITFREDDDLRIHRLFQTWLYYINAVTTNLFAPRIADIRDNRFDYACSVYCITCKADATSIVHWAKYTGVIPTNCPNSDLSFNLRGDVNNKVTIAFEYFRQEAWDPYILLDFNKNAHVTSNASNIPYIPVYRSEKVSALGMVDSRSKERLSMTEKTTKFKKSAPISLGSGNGLVGAPFICKVGKQYELRWKSIKNLSPG